MNQIDINELRKFNVYIELLENINNNFTKFESNNRFGTILVKPEEMERCFSDNFPILLNVLYNIYEIIPVLINKNYKSSGKICVHQDNIFNIGCLSQFQQKLKHLIKDTSYKELFIFLYYLRNILSHNRHLGKRGVIKCSESGINSIEIVLDLQKSNNTKILCSISNFSNLTIESNNGKVTKLKYYLRLYDLNKLISNINNIFVDFFGSCIADKLFSFDSIQTEKNVQIYFNGIVAKIKKFAI